MALIGLAVQQKELTKADIKVKLQKAMDILPEEIRLVGFDMDFNIACAYKGFNGAVKDGYKKSPIIDCINGVLLTHQGIFWLSKRQIMEDRIDQTSARYYEYFISKKRVESKQVIQFKLNGDSIESATVHKSLEEVRRTLNSSHVGKVISGQRIKTNESLWIRNCHSHSKLLSTLNNDDDGVPQKVELLKLKI